MAGGEAPAKKSGGLMGFLVPVIVLTVVAAGGGAMLGTQIVGGMHPAGAPDAKPAGVAAAQAPDTVLKELTPIVTNLTGADSASWVRLQAAIVYAKADAPQMDLLAARLGDDLLTVIRTLTVADLQGASGLEILREDLNERASIRSDGHIRELIIETLVVQ